MEHAAPTANVGDYVLHLLKHLECSAEFIVMTLVYVTRVLPLHEIHLPTTGGDLHGARHPSPGGRALLQPVLLLGRGRASRGFQLMGSGSPKASGSQTGGAAEGVQRMPLLPAAL